MSNDRFYSVVMMRNRSDHTQPIFYGVYDTQIDAVRKMNELARRFVGKNVYVLETVEGACAQVMVDQLF